MFELNLQVVADVDAQFLDICTVYPGSTLNCLTFEGMVAKNVIPGNTFHKLQPGKHKENYTFFCWQQHIQIVLPATRDKLQQSTTDLISKSDASDIIGGYVGCIDWWLWCIQLPGDATNHYKQCGLNVQVICDARLQFRYTSIMGTRQTNDVKTFLSAAHWENGHTLFKMSCTSLETMHTPLKQKTLSCVVQGCTSTSSIQMAMTSLMIHQPAHVVLP